MNYEEIVGGTAQPDVGFFYGEYRRLRELLCRPRQWGNLEGCLSGELLTKHLWREVDQVTVEYINRPENRKLIGDFVFGKK